MTKEEQILFMQYAEESWLYNLFALMLRTGLRNGEIRGLKYTDVDKKANLLHISRTLVEVENGTFIEEPPKTKTSKRDIP